MKEDAEESGKKGFVNFKRVVWHESFKVFLRKVAEYSKLGYWQKCGDKQNRRLFPIPAILSSDYEEQ